MRRFLPLAGLLCVLAGCGSSSGGGKPTPTGTAGVVLGSPVSTTRLSPTPGQVKTLPPAPTATPISARDYTARVRGTVTDSKTGSPIPGAVVTVGAGSRTARTDAFGQFTVAFPAGPATPITVVVNGFTGGLAMGSLKPHQTATVHFKLNPLNGKGPVIPPLPIRFGAP